MRLACLVLDGERSTLYRGDNRGEADKVAIAATEGRQIVHIKTYHKVGKSVCVNDYKCDGGEVTFVNLTYLPRDEIELVNEVLSGSD